MFPLKDSHDSLKLQYSRLAGLSHQNFVIKYTAPTLLNCRRFTVLNEDGEVNDRSSSTHKATPLEITGPVHVTFIFTSMDWVFNGLGCEDVMVYNVSLIAFPFSIANV